MFDITGQCCKSKEHVLFFVESRLTTLIKLTKIVAIWDIIYIIFIII